MEAAVAIRSRQRAATQAGIAAAAASIARHHATFVRSISVFGTAAGCVSAVIALARRLATAAAAFAAAAVSTTVAA